MLGINTPIWAIYAAKYDLSLCNLGDAATKNAGYRYKFNAINEHNHTNSTLISTDGSEKHNGWRFAAVAGNTVKASLSLTAFNFTAELLAIYLALCFIETTNKTAYVVCADSLTSLLTLIKKMTGGVL